MNMAARTESSCPPGCVQLTDAAFKLCVPHLPHNIGLQCRGAIMVKGSEEPIVMHLASSSVHEEGSYEFPSALSEQNDDCPQSQDDYSSPSLSGWTGARIHAPLVPSTI